MGRISRILFEEDVENRGTLFFNMFQYLLYSLVDNSLTQWIRNTPPNVLQQKPKYDGRAATIYATQSTMPPMYQRQEQLYVEVDDDY